MPNKNLLIAGAGVLILIAVGAVGFMIMSKSSQKSAEQLAVTKETVQSSNSVPTTKESLMGLFAAGKSVTCKFTADDGSNNGTVYVADKKMRGDFNVKDANGKVAESHMIQDGDISYFWTGVSGTKMKIDATSKASPASGQGEDLNKQQDMNCSGWSVDSSKFTVPADVKFMDVSGITGQTQTQTQTQTKKEISPSADPSSFKAACETITDPVAKADCLSVAGSSGY